eukprot:PhF_6_TR603/c3_g1_i2/m.738/K00856/E2.7.1.20, ADK; adenosine kinase
MGCGNSKPPSKAAAGGDKKKPTATKPPPTVILPPPQIAKVAHVVTFDNPLLDIIAEVDTDFLKEWKLEPNGAVLATPELMDLFDNVSFLAGSLHVSGGSGLNSMRVLQWKIAKIEDSVTKTSPCHFVGTINPNDRFGKMLSRDAQASGIDFVATQDAGPTGTCAVLISGKQRSLVANLGASAVFDDQWLYSNSRVRQAVEKSHYVYITGFFLRTAPDLCFDIASNSADCRVVSLNLSAPFVVQFFTDLVKDFLPSTGLVFGNKDELLTFSRKMGWTPSNEAEWGEEDHITALKKMQAMDLNGLSVHGHKKRLIFITDGADAVYVATDEGVSRHEVPMIDEEDIVDTNGCGDAFVAGIFTYLLLRAGTNPTTPMDVAEAVEYGNECAAVVIRQSGCTLPSMNQSRKFTTSMSRSQVYEELEESSRRRSSASGGAGGLKKPKTRMRKQSIAVAMEHDSDAVIAATPSRRKGKGK